MGKIETRCLSFAQKDLVFKTASGISFRMITLQIIFSNQPIQKFPDIWIGWHTNWQASATRPRLVTEKVLQQKRVGIVKMSYAWFILTRQTLLKTFNKQLCFKCSKLFIQLLLEFNPNQQHLEFQYTCCTSHDLKNTIKKLKYIFMLLNSGKMQLRLSAFKMFLLSIIEFRREFLLYKIFKNNHIM